MSDRPYFSQAEIREAVQYVCRSVLRPDYDQRCPHRQHIKDGLMPQEFFDDITKLVPLVSNAVYDGLDGEEDQAAVMVITMSTAIRVGIQIGLLAAEHMLSQDHA